MPAVTIRNLSEETHRALKARAARHGQSAEAEIRNILDQAVRPEARTKLGSLLAEIGHSAELTGEDCDALDHLRDPAVTEPPSFL
jgi:plasmid stability protein